MARTKPSSGAHSAREKLDHGTGASMSLSDFVELQDWVELHGSGQSRQMLVDMHDAEDAMILSAQTAGDSDLAQVYRLKQQSFISLALAEKLASPASIDSSVNRFYLGVGDIINWR